MSKPGWTCHHCKKVIALGEPHGCPGMFGIKGGEAGLAIGQALIEMGAALSRCRKILDDE